MGNLSWILSITMAWLRTERVIMICLTYFNSTFYFYTKPAIACSKLTIETLKQNVKYANSVVLVSLLLALNMFHILF